MTPIDISRDNTPITAEQANAAGPGKGECGGACGGRCGGRKQGHLVRDRLPVSHDPLTLFLLALVIAAGLGLMGYFIGQGAESFSRAQRVIDTRGFAERSVKADLAIWNIGYVATGDDLTAVQMKVEGDNARIRAFLTQNGLDGREIIELPTSMTDLLARDYRSEGAHQGRYIVNAGLRVRSNKVDLVQSLSGMRIGALIKSGVTLREGQSPVYLFTRLKDVKPEMVAEATRDARAAAEQFAKDSGAQLGRMKSATQGVFQFLPRDQAMGVDENFEINKTVRVVTTVRYLLED